MALVVQINFVTRFLKQLSSWRNVLSVWYELLGKNDLCHVPREQARNISLNLNRDAIFLLNEPNNSAALYTENTAF
jgi:hypothetical protein